MTVNFSGRHFPSDIIMQALRYYLACREMDETYINIKGRWVYYYRAVDKYGAIIDFYLS
jgi:putative transposase